MNKGVDEDGKFDCGQGSEPESIQIKDLPSDFQCTDCKLEFTWEDSAGPHTTTSDVKIYSTPEAKDNGSSNMSYLLALAAAVGGGLVVYKALVPKNEEVKETPAPEVKPTEDEKFPLKPPESEVITERGASKPPRREEATEELIQEVKPEEPIIEAEVKKEEEEVKELKTPKKEEPLVNENNPSPALANTPDLRQMESIFINQIQKIITSDQIQEAEDFREQANSGRFSWKKTHFIFVIDCSGSMRGTRWDSVKFGLKTCLNRLKTMEEIMISGFTFDDNVRDFCREVTPEEAIKLSQDMTFSAKGTNYMEGLEHAMRIINEAKHKDYLACIMFLSDGLGGLPKDTIEEIKEMKKQGMKILFYTIACATEDDDDMIIMSTNLGGEHYKVTNSEASKIVFTKILEV